MQVDVSMVDLNDKWWDWRVEGWNGSTFRLVAGNDLTYHHLAAVEFHDAAFVACPSEFSHPRFREATGLERDAVWALLGGDRSAVVFAWDVDGEAGQTCLVAAASVSVHEGLVLHETPAVASPPAPLSVAALQAFLAGCEADDLVVLEATLADGTAIGVYKLEVGTGQGGDDGQDLDVVLSWQPGAEVLTPPVADR